jgi:hypothetical protein
MFAGGGVAQALGYQVIYEGAQGAQEDMPFAGHMPSACMVHAAKVGSVIAPHLSGPAVHGSGSVVSMMNLPCTEPSAIGINDAVGIASMSRIASPSLTRAQKEPAYRFMRSAESQCSRTQQDILLASAILWSALQFRNAGCAAHEAAPAGKPY